MAVTTADQMKKQTGDTSQFNTAFDARKAESQGTINTTMDKSLNTQTQGLADAYAKNVTAQTNATNAGQQAFNTGVADLGVQTNRTERGMDSFADVRNLNRQDGSQQALQLGMARRQASGSLANQQALALQESQRQQELLKTNYQNQVQQAIANNDYRRAAALLDDYNNQNSWLENNAALLASYGNFAGYENLYGADQAGAMKNYWVGSNPLLAYNTGAIDAAKYKELTGQNAPDKQASGGYNWGNVSYWAGGRPVYDVKYGGTHMGSA